MTWNEYLDEVIKEVEKGFSILEATDNISEVRIYRTKLYHLMWAYPPYPDPQSRIDFLNSLKDKE